jgi:hypothetical protein
MHSPRRARRRATSRALSLFAGALLLTTAAACSGGDSADDTTAAPTTTAPATTTTAARPTTTTSTTTTSTTTTAAATTTTTTIAETTTTLPPKPIYPLTGVENPDPAIAARPALVVKIDNAPGARPQTGFNSADIVYEEIVNDNLTRFAMVFQSGSSNPVGPIRSGRLQDIDLFTAYNHPLFAWSGGNKTVTAAIDASELHNIGPSHARVYFRSSARRIPHNLYANTDDLFAQAAADSPPAAQQFAYREPGAPPAGEPLAGVDIKLDAVDVQWGWDSVNGIYRRVMEKRPHIDAGTNSQVTTNNVVILSVEYRPGISDSPDAQTLGGGEVLVLTGGNAIHGTWSRDDIHHPMTLRADDGTPIQLQPGRTFVELPRPGNVRLLTEV